ncbi:MAG: hypothetical protein E3J35_10545 [Methanomassiliicoccales archaeon]|nr:MAG: hypothetical protein E3J35_10545 [Methanomassiliicoccales archaeon]
MSSSRKADRTLPSVVYLYDEPSTPSLRIGEIEDFLKEKIPDLDVRMRKDFLSFHSRDLDKLAEKLAATKVRGMEGLKEEAEPLYGEVQFEKRMLREPHRRIMGMLYDGFRLQQAFRELLPEKELRTDFAHVVFTNRIFCTYEKGDARYHARVIMCGYPSLISTSGLVEAPAKPKEFYVIKQKYAAVGAEPPVEELKESIKGRFIDHGDENITQALKGYVLQSLFYHATGEPFCKDRNCILFNAHWQEEVINAQIVSGRLCSVHGEMLREMVGSQKG